MLLATIAWMFTLRAIYLRMQRGSLRLALIIAIIAAIIGNGLSGIELLGIARPFVELYLPIRIAFGGAGIFICLSIYGFINGDKK
jgi:hypothetical protein